MVATPWGDSEELRSQMVASRHTRSRKELWRQQRERLFAATVAVVAGKGYEATTVREVAWLAGTSVEVFYREFEDKRDCVVTVAQETVEMARRQMASELQGARGVDDVRRVFEGALELIGSQRAASYLCLVATCALGPAQRPAVEDALGGFERIVASALRAAAGQGGPAELCRAITSGLLKQAHTSTYRGQAQRPSEVAAQWNWILSYAAPPGRLKRPAPMAPAQRPFEWRLASASVQERLLLAGADLFGSKGPIETTVEEIALRASTSNRAFYAQFADKWEGLLAALDSGYSQMLATALPALRRGRDWPSGAREMVAAMLAAALREPEYARLIYTAPNSDRRRALELQDEAIGELATAIEPEFGRRMADPATAARAAVAALFALIGEHLRDRGPEGMLTLQAAGTYLLLAPSLGAEEAYRAAVA